MKLAPTAVSSRFVLAAIIRIYVVTLHTTQVKQRGKELYIRVYEIDMIELICICGMRY